MKKLLTGTIVLSVFLLGGTLLAQYRQQEDAHAYPDTIDQDEREILARAERFAADGKWENAFVQLQALLDKCGNKVVNPGSLKDDAKSDSFKIFVSISDFLGEKMRRLPPDARKVYITLYDFQARAAYKKALQTGVESTLLDTALNYPISTITADCYERIAEFSVERGNLKQAALSWQKAAETAPAEDSRKTIFLYRAAAALAAGGNKPAADALLQKIGDDAPPKYAVQDIKQLLDAPPISASEPTDANSDVWLLPGKSPENTRLNSCSGKAFSTRWRVNFSKLEGFAPTHDPNLWINNVPLFDGKQVLVGIHNYIFALDVNDGSLIWKKQLVAGPPAVNDGTQFLHQPGICVANGAIYCAAYGRLYAINQTTGELLWNEPLKYTKKDGRAQVCFSVPFVLDDGVFITDNVCSDEGLSYIRRYTALTGKPVWETYVGGATIIGSRGAAQISPMPLCARNGDLLLGNNLGIIARVNAVTGKMRWIFTYPSSYNMLQASALPVISGDIAYIGPGDSRRHFALNWETGTHVNLLFSPEPALFLGVKNGLVFSGTTTLSASVLQPEKKEFDSAWKSVLPDNSVVGQPVFGETYLYLPTAKNLQVIDYNKERGERIANIPIEGANNYPGSLIATRDLLISLNDRYLTVLAEVGRELPRLEAALKKTPQNPQLQFRKGLCLENKEDYAGAFEAWQKAHACAKPEDNIFGEPAANFISRKICLTALLSVPAAKTLAEKEKYYSLAVKYPAVNPEWVTALMDMAAFCETNKLVKDTARMWHRMTAFPSGYLVRTGEVDMAANFYGQKRLLELCKKENKNSAEMVLGQDTSLTVAEAGKMNEEELRQVFMGFPYSKRGLSAVTPLAKKLAESNNRTSVVYLWQEAWNQSPNSETAAGLLNAYEAAGNYSQAKLLLLSAKEKIGDQPAPQGNTWRNFADKKCAEPLYASLTPSPVDTLNVISEKYAVPTQNMTNSSIPIEVQGTTDAKLANLRFAQVRKSNGPFYYSPADMTQMKPLWEKSEITLRSPNRVITDGKVLVVGGTEGIFILDFASGKTLKNFPGFFSDVRFLDNRLCLLDNQAQLTTYDCKTMQVLFTQNLQNCAQIQKTGRKGNISYSVSLLPLKNAILCLSPGKIAAINPTTGKITHQKQTAGQLTFDSEKSPSEALFWELSPQRTVSLLTFNHQDGTTKVTPLKNMPNIFSFRAMRISDTQRLVVSEHTTTLVDIQRAEMLWNYSLPQTGGIIQRFVDNNTLYLLGNNKQTVVEVSMTDGKMIAQTALTDLPSVGMAATSDINSGRYLVVYLVNNQYARRGGRYYNQRNAEAYAPTQILIFDKLNRQVVWRCYKSINFMFVLNGKLHIQQPAGLWRFE